MQGGLVLPWAWGGVLWLTLSEPGRMLLLKLHHVCATLALMTWCGKGHCMSRLSQHLAGSVFDQQHNENCHAPSLQ